MFSSGEIHVQLFDSCFSTFSGLSSPGKLCIPNSYEISGFDFVSRQKLWGKLHKLFSVYKKLNEKESHLVSALCFGFSFTFLKSFSWFCIK